MCVTSCTDPPILESLLKVSGHNTWCTDTGFALRPATVCADRAEVLFPATTIHWFQETLIRLSVTDRLPRIVLELLPVWKL
ncbi:hypothetical protein E2C01_093989 [Portunus trituberculatus]|uniref:Uncharacterized protein n=1 Tax=Portunus trituberculatus TaxID=210409 RepID=A0A5B7JVR8_PORTR|nr:hypothetical protein [Portunus trituberculatus]